MSASDDPGWSWFEKEVGQIESPTLSQDDIAACFARCFRGQEGETALSHLAQMTLGRPLGANAHNGILRHLEGQRYLVSYIIGLVRAGRDPKHK